VNQPVHYTQQGRLAPLSKELYLSLTPAGKAIFRRVKAAEKYLSKLTRDYELIMARIAEDQLAETSPPSTTLPAQDPGLKGGLNAEVKAAKDSFDWSPFHKIPNVERFTVKIGEKDTFYEKFGIDRKVPPVLEFTPYRNNQFIKYARFTIKRLRNTKSDLLY
jgi:hypothetical protein